MPLSHEKLHNRDFRARWSTLRSYASRPAVRIALRLVEIALIAIWAAYVGRDFLGTTHLQINSGGDNVSAYGRFFWDRLKDCGTCALWSGQVNGGAPAYIDSNSDVFHPAVAIPALLVGTLASFKLTIVICLFMGGLACWWLALELGTGAVARIAAGFMGAAGGYLAGRSYQGLVVVLTSVTAAAFIVPALLRLRRKPTRRSAGLLGIVIGLFILAGQGYLQVGFVMMAPIFLILMTGAWDRWRLYLVRAVQALAVGLLIPAVFLFPFARYYSQFSKPTDPAFLSHQPFHYLVLNLVINDWDYMRADRLLGKQSMPGLYVNYVGWAVIIFAVAGLFVLWQRSKPVVLVLGLLIVGALWIGSGAPFQLMARDWAPPALRDFAVSIRNPTFIAGAAAPAIIGLAAVGVDTGLHWTHGMQPRASLAGRYPWLQRAAAVTVRAGTIALLVIALVNLERGANQWLMWEPVTQERADLYLDALATDEVAWVSPPDSDWRLQMLGFDAGYKYSDGWRPWTIGIFTQQPTPFKMVRFDPALAPPSAELVDENSVGLVYRSTLPNQYATVSSGGTCSAHGEAGNIDIACDAPAAGTLTVQENAFDGWNAMVNGNEVGLADGQQWVTIEVPAGTSTIELRYRPWDFWVGLMLSMFGIALAIVMLVVPDRYRLHATWRRPQVQSKTTAN